MKFLHGLSSICSGGWVGRPGMDRIDYPDQSSVGHSALHSIREVEPKKVWFPWTSQLQSIDGDDAPLGLQIV